MRELSEKSYLEKLILKLNLVVGRLGIKPVYFGVDNSTGVLNHYNGSDHLDALGFRQNYFSSQKHDCLIIYGHINLNQIQLLKKVIEKNKELKNLVVHIRGPLISKLQKKSYFLCNDLSEHLDVDIKYERYPVDLERLCDEIREVQRSRIND